MPKPSIGVAIVATERDTLFDKCVRKSETQADAVVTLVDDSIGLSEARNEATNDLHTDVYAFIDADAHPANGWADALRFEYDRGASAVGGPAQLVWPKGIRDDRIPDGWEWLVGGGPYHKHARPVRNTYGTNFSMRAEVFDDLGGFDETLGKGADVPHGEETDLAKRMHAEYNTRMRYTPDATVYHHVSGAQLQRPALLRRAYHQGYTKAVIGAGHDETSFVTDHITSKDPWLYALLSAAGIGYLRGVLHG